MPTRREGARPEGSAHHDAAELLRFLDLEQIDRDIYRGRPGVWPEGRPTLYGGEVAAQALRAAAHTVPEDRFPHSLHGYFLRPGDPSAPLVFLVDRDRDGRSFSARRVAAVQRGEVIWEMACSFHLAKEGPEFTRPVWTGIEPPEQSRPIDVQWAPLLDIRIPLAPDDSPPSGWLDRCWIRVVARLPDDDDDVVMHACLHTFASDVAAGFGGLQLDGLPLGGASIDHALWFHHRSRADDWVFYDCTPAKVGGHRGLYTGTAHDLDGNLVAMLAQEMLLRPPGPTTS